MIIRIIIDFVVLLLAAAVGTFIGWLIVELYFYFTNE